MSQKEYRSHARYLQSDHKPVTCLFTLSLSRADVPDSDPTVGLYQSEAVSLDPFFVEFYSLNDWTIDHDNHIRFKFIDGKTSFNSNRRISSRLDRSWDWIGVYPADFSSLDDWVTYVWADESNATNDMLITQTTASAERSGERGSYFTATFPHVMLKPGSEYLLIYFAGESSLDVLGISQPFRARVAN